MRYYKVNGVNVCGVHVHAEISTHEDYPNVVHQAGESCVRHSMGAVSHAGAAEEDSKWRRLLREAIGREER